MVRDDDRVVFVVLLLFFQLSLLVAQTESDCYCNKCGWRSISQTWIYKSKEILITCDKLFSMISRLFYKMKLHTCFLAFLANHPLIICHLETTARKIWASSCSIRNQKISKQYLHNQICRDYKALILLSPSLTFTINNLQLILFARSYKNQE